jgi:superfamily II DNA or RNA helicase/HKD family nuclease
VAELHGDPEAGYRKCLVVKNGGIQLTGAMSLSLGLYQQVINERVGREVEDVLAQNLKVLTNKLDPGDSHSHLARCLTSHVTRALQSFPTEKRIECQLQLVNNIIDTLVASAPAAFQEEQAKVLRSDLLLAVLQSPIERPDTPLASSCLMTGTRQDPSLVSQLRKEIGAADRVDILCSFIKWSGVRIIEDALQKLAANRCPLRVITTSYMGATDLKAVESLREMANSNIKVSYDTRRTRLHAKAYIIHRQTGFGVAYIGSSNISQAALTDGLEWNVKISQHESPHIWAKLCATFDAYWNDPEFVPYSAVSREQLRLALQQECAGAGNEEEPAFFFDIKPYMYQEEILQRLQAEREVHGRYKNLVVAATGTGKSVVAGFDYARFKRIADSGTTGGTARLLFVAHREEILRQSLRCFQTILRNYNFGDLLVGQNQPSGLDHLFVSIQSFNSRQIWNALPSNHYDFVVIDEFHHAAAPSYRRLLEWVQPRVLLGLTATPERHDELNILQYFDNHIAAEIRLPDAINRKLLCPFQYFGVTDSVDYRGLRWQRGGYATEDLEHALTGNDIRARLIIEKTREILLDVRLGHGLGFCVSIQHAEYMARVFNSSGIPAAALSADSPRELRNSIQQKLVERTINFIFVVDLYNEGVDIPEVDTLLLLRPTESLTVFLQQLGRGLRLHPNKDCLTVLDFIGQAHANYNFEAKFRALLTAPSRKVDEQIENGFPHLPAGCAVNLERLAREYVLENIRQAVSHNRNRLVRRIATFQAETGSELTMQSFLAYHRLAIDEIYQRDCWSRLCVEAGIRPPLSESDTDRLAKGLRRLAHLNGPLQIKSLISNLPKPVSATFSEPPNETARRLLLMLHFSLWTSQWCPASLKESISRLTSNPVLYEELRTLLQIKLESIDELPPKLELPFSCPLELHSDYTRDEILAGLGVWTLESQRELREGVLFVEKLPTDIFFVTLNKTEGEYSPTTMYDDYAINDSLFHWQSQSTTSVKSPTGQRYINHQEKGSTILLFVRENKKRQNLAQPYCFLGPADYVSHEGSRPMNITWRLRHAMPAKILRTTSRLSNE